MGHLISTQVPSQFFPQPRRLSPVCKKLSVFRGIQAEELGRFCERIMKQLRNEDWGTETLDSLRRLFLIISATKYARK